MFTGQAGSVLVSVMLLCAFVVILGAGFSTSAGSEVRTAHLDVKETQACEIAEAGVARALNRLYEEPGWRAGFADEGFAGGWYDVQLDDQGDREVLITSTGTSGDALVTVTQLVEVLGGGLGSFALYSGADDGMHLLGNQEIVVGDSGGDIYINGKLTAGAHVTIDGVDTLYLSERPDPDDLSGNFELNGYKLKKQEDIDAAIARGDMEIVEPMEFPLEDEEEYAERDSGREVVDSQLYDVNLQSNEIVYVSLDEAETLRVGGSWTGSGTVVAEGDIKISDNLYAPDGDSIVLITYGDFIMDNGKAVVDAYVAAWGDIILTAGAGGGSQGGGMFEVTGGIMCNGSPGVHNWDIDYSEPEIEGTPGVGPAGIKLIRWDMSD